MTDYTSKPLTPESGPAVFVRPGLAETPAATATERQAPASLVDLSFVGSQIGNDETLRRELFEVLARDLEGMEHELRRALESHAWDSLGRIAHHVSGSASNVGATDVCQAADTITALIRRADHGSLDDAGLRLERALAQLRDALRTLLVPLQAIESSES